MNTIRAEQERRIGSHERPYEIVEAKSRVSGGELVVISDPMEPIERRLIEHLEDLQSALIDEPVLVCTLRNDGPSATQSIGSYSH